MSNVSLVKFKLFCGNSEIFLLKLDNGSTAECSLSSRLELNPVTGGLGHANNNIST